MRPDKAEACFRRVLGLGANPATEAYALLQLAIALDRQHRRRPEALTVLHQLRQSRYADTYWGQYGLFRLALFTYNQHQDSREVMPLYKQMFTKYPNHPKAYSALLCYVLDAVDVGDTQALADGATLFLGRYGDSPHAAYIRTLIYSSTPRKE